MTHSLFGGLGHPVRKTQRRATVLVTVVAMIAVAVVFLRAQQPTSSAPTCVVTGPSGRFRVDVSQAANATTIAAVGKRQGLQDHAVTVALVASLQESKLHNLDHGDRDSVGLFQQRPSQGWGSRSKLLVPRQAAAAFYGALVQVPGWADMAVGDAAQLVQRSAAPDAYVPWEAEGRALAEALTGEAPAGLTCQFPVPARPTATGSLTSAVASELGSPALGASLAAARGWVVASWLVGHAYTYRITSVSFAGLRWTPSAEKWEPRLPVVSQVQLDLP
ncbi:MAG: hypothetical protein ACR2HY_05805 [Acidimicrobiales bacterium]